MYWVKSGQRIKPGVIDYLRGGSYCEGTWATKPNREDNHVEPPQQICKGLR